jgi:protein SCO1/2
MERALTLSLPLLLVLTGAPLRAQPGLPQALRNVGFDQKLNEQVPLDLVFKDETGQTVRLGDCWGDKPVILVLAYFRCPMLCDQVLNGLVRAMLDLPFDVGKEFNVITVSFDPRETPEMAAAKKQTLLERYGRPGAAAGWHFLTGDQSAIQRLTDAVGFRYTYDAKNEQFAHASGIVVLTPTGKISRYFHDIRFEPRDVRLGLVEASANRIGSASDQVLLYCFHYDPAEGKYGLVVMNLVRLGGILTCLGLGIFGLVLWRWERRPLRDHKYPSIKTQTN